VSENLPAFLEDMLVASASPHANPTKANDAMNLMEVFGVPSDESRTVEHCEFRGPTLHFVVDLTDVGDLAENEIPQLVALND
jgi:hypothetical protein